MSNGDGTAEVTSSGREPVRYVVGLLFDTYGGMGTAATRLLLINKKRPGWQAGFLNGVGGKIEGAETPRQAMARKFVEEVLGDDYEDCTPEERPNCDECGRPAVSSAQPGRDDFILCDRCLLPWESFAVVRRGDPDPCEVWFLRARDAAWVAHLDQQFRYEGATGPTDEQPEVIWAGPMADFSSHLLRLLPKLRWLIPLALDPSIAPVVELDQRMTA